MVERTRMPAPAGPAAPPARGGAGRTILIILLILLLGAAGAAAGLLFRRCRQLEGDLSGRTRERDNLQNNLREQESRARGELAAEQAKVADRDQALQSRQQQLDDLGRQLAGREGEVERLNRRLAERDRELEQSRQELADQPERQRELEARLADRDRAIAAGQEELAERERRLAALREELANKEEQAHNLAAQLVQAILHDLPVPGEAPGRQPLIETPVVEVRGEPPAQVVIFNAGLQDGLNSYALLNVRRGDRYIGKVFVQESAGSLSSGITVEKYLAPNERVAIGDVVTNRLQGAAAAAEREFCRRLSQAEGDPLAALTGAAGLPRSAEQVRAEAERLLEDVRQGRVQADGLAELLGNNEELKARLALMREEFYRERADRQTEESRRVLIEDENRRLEGPGDFFRPGPYNPPPRVVGPDPRLRAEVLQVRPIPLSVPDPADPRLSQEREFTACTIGLGQRQGVVANQEFDIFRGEQFVARVVVTQVEENVCFAQPRPEWSQQPIEAGDVAWSRQP